MRLANYGTVRHNARHRRTYPARRAWILFSLCILLVLANSACSLGTSVNKVSSVPPSPQSTVPGADATATPLPGQPVLTPALGGTPDAFDRAFGVPRSSTSTAAQYATSLHGIQVYIVTHLTQADAGERASSIEIQSAAAAPWNASTAAMVAAAMFPPDAQHVSDRQTATYGKQHIYHSVSLAASFPADAFRALNGDGLVHPGSFFFSCSDPTTPHSSCVLKIGY